MVIAAAFHMVIDWRWQRVKELDDTGTSTSRQTDDAWVKRARSYQKKRKLLHTGADAKLSKAFPAIHLAHEIRMNSMVHFRWIIEAAVMAKVKRDWLTQFIGLPEGVIEAYEMLFFDVRSTLEKSPGYVAGALLSPIIAAGIRANDPDGYWKVLAFNGGWEVIEASWLVGQSSPEAMRLYKSIAIKFGMRKAAASALGLQPNSFNAVDILRVGIERAQYEEDRGQGSVDDKNSQALEVLVQNVNVLVQNARTPLPAEEKRLALPDASDIYAARQREQRAAQAKKEAAADD